MQINTANQILKRRCVFFTLQTINHNPVIICFSISLTYTCNDISKEQIEYI